jgi:hypothetical protein
MTAAFIRREWRPTVTTDRAPDGQRRRHTTDEAGNTVTEWARSDRQDVTLRTPSLGLVLATSHDVRREARREALRRRRSLAWLRSDVWQHILRHDLVDIRRHANGRTPPA